MAANDSVWMMTMVMVMSFANAFLDWQNSVQRHL